MKLLLTILAICLSVPLLADEKKEKEEFEKMKHSAEKGNVVAQNNLGVMYEKGQGVEQDDKEAVKWYRKAARL